MRVDRRSRVLALLTLLLFKHAHPAVGQLSKPVASDKHWEEQVDNKYLQRAADNDKDESQYVCCCPQHTSPSCQVVPINTHTILPCRRFEEFAATGPNICPLDIELKWMTEVSSSVYATPLITDLYADGRKDIIVPGGHKDMCTCCHVSSSSSRVPQVLWQCAQHGRLPPTCFSKPQPSLPPLPPSTHHARPPCHTLMYPV